MKKKIIKKLIELKKKSKLKQLQLHEPLLDNKEVLITKDIYRFRNETNLVFPNSISNVENFVYEGNFLAKENDENEVFFPHHSLLSNDLRRDVERNAKEGKKPMTIVCTATL